jgi:phenylacetate-CoA ligase
MKNIPNKKIMSQTEVRDIQEKKLKELLHYVNEHSPYYRNIFSKHQLDISGIRGLEDLSRIPTTSKEDLQSDNDSFLCVPKSSVLEYTSTSGTLGAPVTIALTENDLERLAYNEFNSFTCAGCQPSDIFQLMLTLDRQFMAGMAYYSGIRKLGAGIIRVGPGVPSLQWETIFRLKPTVLVAVPSFILKMVQYAADHKMDPAKSSVKKAVCIGENIRHTDFSLNILGKKISELWNIQLFSTYASTEMQTAFTECETGRGGHLQPELLIVELLDADDNPVVAGEAGEVTITTLGVEAMPLIRYKTGDLCIAHTEPCSCGRQTMRLSPVIGRKKQMIKFKGTTLFAPALFDLLTGMEDITEYVAEVFSNEIGTDEVLLHILPLHYTVEADHRIRAYLQAKLRVTPQIRYASAEEIQKLQFPSAGRKPLRFIDNRRPMTEDR